MLPRPICYGGIPVSVVSTKTKRLGGSDLTSVLGEPNFTPPGYGLRTATICPYHLGIGFLHTFLVLCGLVDQLFRPSYFARSDFTSRRPRLSLIHFATARPYLTAPLPPGVRPHCYTCFLVTSFAAWVHGGASADHQCCFESWPCHVCCHPACSTPGHKYITGFHTTEEALSICLTAVCSRPWFLQFNLRLSGIMPAIRF